MKVLYAVQGTGNGHITRAIEIIPELQKRAETDILISGIQAELELPFDVKYRYKGASFIFGQKGGIDYLHTYSKNYFRRFYKEVKSLPVHDYDLVITDFEPVSAWACYFADKPCIGFGNQFACRGEGVPRAESEDVLGRLVLNYYCPVSTSYGIHFQRYNDKIQTPVIRKRVRNLIVSDQGHITVYLTAFSDKKIIKALSKFPDVKWEVFSKHCVAEHKIGNIHLRPVETEQFLKSMASSSGVVCAAGFSSVSEALYLGKKLLVIPMKKQYEQQCNAEALRQMGVHVIRSLKEKHHPVINDWLTNGQSIPVNYPDNSAEIVEQILREQFLRAVKVA